MRQLRPEFTARNVPNWSPKPSEICAGGDPSKDTCRGEGGAPLVRADEALCLGLAASCRRSATMSHSTSSTCWGWWATGSRVTRWVDI